MKVVVDVAERHDVTEEILAYLTGDAPRPTFEGLSASERDKALATLAEAENALTIDFDMIPSFDEDPVAVRLGLRDGPEEARVYGPAIRHARQTAGLDPWELARSVSGTGHTVDASWVEALEAGTWQTITLEDAEAIAAATDVEPRTLGDPSVPLDLVERVAAHVIAEHSQLTADRFDEPFGAQFPHRVLVSFLDMQILLIVVSANLHDAALGFAVACVADADRYTAVGVVQDDEDLTTWILRPSDVLERYLTPQGTHRPPTTNPDVVPTTLSLALGGLIQGEVVRWPSFDLDIRAVDDDIDGLRSDLGKNCLEKFQKSARRVASDRRDAYATVGEAELARVQHAISRLLAAGGPVDADELINEFSEMDEVS